MSNDNDSDFAGLMNRIERGDAEAAHQLVSEYEPEIRRVIRIRLTDPQLRRTIDSMDICQSVLANFFVRVALGQFDLTHPNQLYRLLSTMATRKIIDRHRKENTQRTALDGYRPPGILAVAGEPVDNHSGPDSVIESRELLNHTLASLSSDERRLVDLRRAGKSWKEIAEIVGISHDAVRKKISRACDRVVGNFDE